MISIDDLKLIVSDSQIKTQEPMKAHTTFKIGGPAKIFITPKSAKEIAGIIKYCKEALEPYAIIGLGSNLLVSDEGYGGVIICIGKEYSDMVVRDNYITACAGASLISVCNLAKTHGLTGLEFGCGIPGSVGGAIYMNAGAHGGEIKDVVTEVTILTADGKIKRMSRDDMNFRYRGSAAMDEGFVILDATFKLAEGDAEKINEKMQELLKLRADKQPLEFPSAGSTFKRPEGNFAGKLIEDAGLRGYQVGGAQVSEKHCGFVVNKGDATAADVTALCEHIFGEVKDQFGVELEMEVRKLGF